MFYYKDFNKGGLFVLILFLDGGDKPVKSFSYVSVLSFDLSQTYIPSSLVFVLLEYN